jgi:mRNA-degrading endonuclease RelE of RelBE toxin-antitoxin system
VILSAAAQKQLAALTKRERERIEDQILILERDPAAVANRIRALKGDDPTKRRLRVGDYRVVFVESATEILVTRIAHRRKVYRSPS